jgi:glycosyltransferase involved in cell wall biosynthesis
MADALQALGHETHFLHLQQPLRFADAGLREYWGPRLHVFRGLSPRSCYGRGRRKALRLAAKSLHLDLPVDSYHDPTAARFLEQLFARRPFDVVVVSYVFYSRLLESAPEGVRRLLDTHDVFAERYRLYRDRGQPGEFFSTSRAGEGKALDRADAVLAIQEADASHFAAISRSPVTVVGHLAPPLEAVPGSSPPAAAMLFVGGPMGINVHGMRWFLEEVLPLVRQGVPGAELWLVGGIGERVRGGGPGVRRLGFVEALDDLYRRAAVVINPQRFGTGLSIKSVDALRHGRPLVATASGARGLEDGAGHAFLAADSAEEFAGHVVRLLRDPAAGAELGLRAAAYSRAYYERNLRALADAVRGTPGR